MSEEAKSNGTMIAGVILFTLAIAWMAWSISGLRNQLERQPTAPVSTPAPATPTPTPTPAPPWRRIGDSPPPGGIYILQVGRRMLIMADQGVAWVPEQGVSEAPQQGVAAVGSK